jgi:recombination protein U
MNLETLVNHANTVYMQSGKAVVFKVPTPTKVLYKNYNGYRMPVKAFHDSKAWLDYVGVVNGKAITFDAKETKKKTSFPLQNLKPHQVYAMDQWNKCGGKSFLIVWFKTINEVYLLPAKVVLYWYKASLEGGRKSIPYKQFQTDAIHILSGNHTYLDWLSAYKNM